MQNNAGMDCERKIKNLHFEMNQSEGFPLY